MSRDALLERGSARVAKRRPCVLVFAGHDPSGGAGIQADIEAIAAQGAHALTVITALTVQDNDRVYALHPVDPDIIVQQARAVVEKFTVSAIKIGIAGNHANAVAIAQFIQIMRALEPDLPVVLDPVLASGHGDDLSYEDPIATIEPLLQIATLITPNLPEAQRLSPSGASVHEQARSLLRHSFTDVLIKGGHALDGDDWICNSWFTQDGQREWRWPRLAGEFHGSGCTLAAAIAGQLALGKCMEESLQLAQAYAHQSLDQAFSIAAGQLIPNRSIVLG
jgi:hydroxymethylpyrimidine/phosphomethylpyrimidine kinase